MAVKVEIPYRKIWNCPRSQSAAYAYLADVANAVPKDFPGVETFTEVEPGLFRWNFERISYGGHDLEIELLTRLNFQAESAIDVTPAGGSGASQLRGGWKIAGDGDKSVVTFDFQLDLELKIPFFLKAVATPLAQKELTKLFDRYVENVSRHLA